MGKAEDMEDRGSAGGPDGGDVAAGDEHGSKLGAEAAQSGSASGSESSGGMSVDKVEESAPGPSHVGGVRKGEELGEDDEPGRYDTGTTHADRPAGGSTARDSTGINPQDEEPIDPDSPTMPTP